MPEYSLSLSEKFIEAAQFVSTNASNSEDAMRVVLYLSCVSCEITMKALLEKAGKPLKDIKKLSHNLEGLMIALNQDCLVQVEIGNAMRWVKATSFRGIEAMPGTLLTIGKFLEAEGQGASRYPVEIRYGSRVTHFPPEAALNSARRLFQWARENFDIICLQSPLQKPRSNRTL
ncbi:MAG: hypothetical protein ACLPX5_08435 [Dissulfurispiraceae bacterium]